jgi:hypothetical protein
MNDFRKRPFLPGEKAVPSPSELRRQAILAFARFEVQAAKKAKAAKPKPIADTGLQQFNAFKEASDGRTLLSRALALMTETSAFAAILLRTTSVVRI